MRYDIVCEPGEVASELTRITKIPVRKVPLVSSPRTTYFVSQDGKHAWWANEISGKAFVSELYIDFMWKKHNASPQFCVSYSGDFRSKITMSKAVFGAFVAGYFPKYNLCYIDGDAKNCSAENLKPLCNCRPKADNLLRYIETYPRFREVVYFLRRIFEEVSIEDLEDICSEAYIELCHKRKKLKSPFFFWLYLAKMRTIDFIENKRNRENAFNDAINPYWIDPACDLEFEKILTKRHARICQLYSEGYTQVEISKKMGICRDLVIRGLAQVRERLDTWLKM